MNFLLWWAGMWLGEEPRVPSSWCGVCSMFMPSPCHLYMVPLHVACEKGGAWGRNVNCSFNKSYSRCQLRRQSCPASSSRPRCHCLGFCERWRQTGCGHSSQLWESWVVLLWLDSKMARQEIRAQTRWIRFGSDLWWAWRCSEWQIHWPETRVRCPPKAMRKSKWNRMWKITTWSTCGGRNLSEHGVLGAAMRAGAAPALWEAAAWRLFLEQMGSSWSLAASGQPVRVVGQSGCSSVSTFNFIFLTLGERAVAVSLHHVLLCRDVWAHFRAGKLLPWPVASLGTQLTDPPAPCFSGIRSLLGTLLSAHAAAPGDLLTTSLRFLSMEMCLQLHEPCFIKQLLCKGRCCYASI